MCQRFSGASVARVGYPPFFKRPVAYGHSRNASDEGFVLLSLLFPIFTEITQ